MSQSIQIQVTQVGLEQSIAAAMKRVGSSAQINLGTNSRQINALSQPLGRITGQADEFTKSMAAANARVLAFGASAGIIAGVSKAMSGLVTSTIKVEKSLTEINSVLNKSGAELDKFGQQIFNVAKNTGKSFDEVASGALELARQGLSAEDTLARLNDALILSRLSGLDAAQSVEGLTAAFNSFKKSGITTAEILNKVVAVSQKYAVSERDIIEGVKRSASVAQQAGVSFDELAAVITAVQQTTARGGAVIGNSFKTIFARIQRKDVLSDLQNMGVAVTDLQGNVLPALRILENLAGQLQNFSQIEQANIAEKLGGVFQLDKLLSALKDLSSEASVTRGALKAAGEAGNSAYEKNIVLNQTLAALLNKVAVNAEQLGAKLGEIGVTDSLKNVLGFFNNLLEGIQKVLGEESGLGNLVRGLVKGLGSFLAGPGLALFGAIILKLSKDLVQFGFASLKAFFGIGKAAKEVQNVEGAISQILAKNVNLQQQLFALEGNRAAQLRIITSALVEQEALLRRSASISSGLAAPLYNVGARATGSGLRVGNSADGYMPAVAKESKAIKQGVGGARSGDKPVVMPNFNFGGGKKGTMVAHTGEYIVPNFSGSGGTAVFNRQMVQSMGLPSGAKKINAAGGLVPNFAKKTSAIGQLGIGGLQGKELKFDFNKYVVGSELENNGDQKTAPYVLAGRIFESKLQGLKYIDIQENRKEPDIKIGKFSVAEAKLSGKAAYNDPNFGVPVSKGGKGNVLVLPSTASQDYDEKLKINKGAVINRKTGITHSSLFGQARAIIEKYKNTPREKIGNVIKIASSGFIPNFAPKFNAETVRKYANEIEKYKLPTKDFYQFPDGTGGYGSQIKNVLSRTQSKAVANQQIKEKKIEDKGFFNLNADALGGILLVSPRFGKGQGSLDTSMQIGEIPFFNQDKSLTIDKNKYIKLAGIKTSNTPSGRDLKSLRADVNELFSDGIVKLAYRLYGETFDPASGGEFSSKLQSLDASRKQQLLPPAAQGDLFEAAGKVALNSFANLESLFGSGEQNRPFDFQNPEALRKVFGVNAKRGEAKRGGEKNFSSSKQVQGIIKKIFNDSEYGSSAVKSLRSQGAFDLSKAQKAANAAGGFIPNFVSKSREIGSGIQGTFYRLGNKDGVEVGVKKFVKDGFSQAAQAEWLVAEYLSKYVKIPAVFGPKNLSKLQDSIRKKAIRKEVVSDQLARNAVGGDVARMFGTTVLFNALKTQGLSIGDLHGSNYTVNESAAKAIRELKNYPQDAAGALSVLKQMASKGAKIGIIDAGLTQVSDPARSIIGSILQKESQQTATAAGGFLPNFASPLQAAVNREMAAGIPASQIYIDKSPALKNAANPMGLMVANRRDEPAGGFQGINRARREGANPMMYGAAGGFVPNYAPQIGQIPVPSSSMRGSSEVSKFNDELKRIALEMRKNNMSYTQAMSAMQNFASTLTLNASQQKQLKIKGAGLIDAYEKEISARNQKAQQLKQDRIDNKQAAKNSGGGRDILGTLFAVQGAMVALTGATEGATSGFAKFANSFGEVASSVSTVVFAGQGLSQALGGAEKGFGKFASKLGVYGAVAVGAYTALNEFAKYQDSNNIGLQKAAEANLKLAEAAGKAAVNLNTLNPVQKRIVEKRADDLIAGARQIKDKEGRTFAVAGIGGLSMQLNQDLESGIAQGLGVGVNYDEIYNKFQEFALSGLEVTESEGEELLKFITDRINKISSEASPSQAIDFLKSKLTPEDIASGFGVDEALNEFFNKSISDPKIIQANIDNVKKELSSTAKEKADAEKEAIEQTQTSIVQDKLKNAIALSIAKARSFENDILGQQLLKGQELGNLSETALRNIQDEIALREINRELQDGTASLIQEQISQAKKITAESKAAIALEEQFKNLSAEQLQDRTVVNGLLEETSKLLQQNSGLTVEQKNALQVTLDKLFGENKIKKDNLQLTQEQTAEYKQQARQLDLISQASKRALEAQSFRSEITATRSINADTAQIRALESSKLGKSDAQVRQIDQQIAAIKENTVALEQGIEKEKIITQLREELIQANKFITPEIRKEYNAQINQASTKEQLQNLAKDIFLISPGEEDQKQQDLDKFIQNMNEMFERFDVSSEAAKAAAKADRETAGAIPPVINALEMFRRSLLDSSQIIDQKIEDINLQQLTSISGKEILQGNYDIETLRRQSGQTPAEAARIARQRQNKGLGQLFAEEYTKTDEERVLNINQAIVDGSVQFKNNMIEGIMGAVEGTSDLKDGLRSAAYEFVKMINQRMMSNLVDKLVGGSVPSGGGAPSGGLTAFFSNMFASGGKVTGGSGSKDDVPAMLMGGEYVVNKRAVAKYGPQFLEAINNGTLSGYAKGGTVQRGPQGNFYTPGTFGQGAISGKRNLLDFATQSGTSGKFDQIINESGYQAISLEPESSRLSVSGMRNSPMFEATQSAKGQAFDLYLQQYNAEKEAKKQEKAQKKAFRNQLIMLAASAALGPVLGAAGAGAKAAFGAAKAGGATMGQSLLAGAKGIFTGGQVLGKQVGGLANLFSGVGKGLTGNFTGAANQFKLSQISNDKQLISLMQSDPKFAGYMGGMDGLDFSGVKRAIPISGASPFSTARANVSTAIRSTKGSNVYIPQNIPDLPTSSPSLADLELNRRQEAYRILTTELGMSPQRATYLIKNRSSQELLEIMNPRQQLNYRSETPLFLNKAIGGMIPSTSGIDTVPAMLSGGEFVMNRSAVQSIGAPNLQSMNAGGTSITSEETSKELNEKLLAKLDELIKVSDSSAAGNITINVAPSGQTTQEGSQDASANRQQLARQIKDAVLQVINDEKRIGGSLRR